MVVRSKACQLSRGIEVSAVHSIVHNGNSCLPQSISFMFSFQTEGLAVHGSAGDAGSVGGAAGAGGAVAEAVSSRPWLSVCCRPPSLWRRPAGRAVLGTAKYEHDHSCLACRTTGGQFWALQSKDMIIAV